MLLGIFVVQPIALGLYDIHISVETSVGLAVIFTVVSFVRGYIVRRIFNHYTVKDYNDTKMAKK